MNGPIDDHEVFEFEDWNGRWVIKCRHCDEVRISPMDFTHLSCPPTDDELDAEADRYVEDRDVDETPRPLYGDPTGGWVGYTDSEPDRDPAIQCDLPTSVDHTDPDFRAAVFDGLFHPADDDHARSVHGLVRTLLDGRTVLATLRGSDDDPLATTWLTENDLTSHPTGDPPAVEIDIVFDSAHAGDAIRVEWMAYYAMGEPKPETIPADSIDFPEPVRIGDGVSVTIEQLLEFTGD